MDSKHDKDKMNSYVAKRGRDTHNYIPTSPMGLRRVFRRIHKKKILRAVIVWVGCGQETKKKNETKKKKHYEAGYDYNNINRLLTIQRMIL
jgi:hypothetical protein